jgi:broad specificity phosphatase PhoE
MNLRRFHCLPACLLAVVWMALTGCASQALPAPDPTAVLSFVVVRHAEKSVDDAEDPNLSPAGRTRAAALARELSGVPLAAIYATEYRRTQQTAQPTAAAQGQPVSRYFSRGPASETVAQWRERHRHGTVLVVGHSNTVPDLVAALCHCQVAFMAEDEYDRWSVVRFDASGQARLETRRYGAAHP